jgi:hypothetical protein
MFTQLSLYSRQFFTIGAVVNIPFSASGRALTRPARIKGADTITADA